jgi:hypothetical protein
MTVSTGASVYQLHTEADIARLCALLAASEQPRKEFADLPEPLPSADGPTQAPHGDLDVPLVMVRHA